MLALPWTEELLARAIEQNLYHGRHMTFCRKRDDKLALVRKIHTFVRTSIYVTVKIIDRSISPSQPADIQTFPNYTALPEVNETMCTEMAKLSNVASSGIWCFDIATFLAILIVAIVLS